jgi:hypothetical protein
LADGNNKADAVAKDQNMYDKASSILELREALPTFGKEIDKSIEEGTYYDPSEAPFGLTEEELKQGEETKKECNE